MLKYILILFFFVSLFACSITPMKPRAMHLDGVLVCVYGTHPDSNCFGPGFGRVIGTEGNSTIIVEGYLYKGKIIFNSPGALGHELIHLLNQRYSDLIWNPDAIGD